MILSPAVWEGLRRLGEAVVPTTGEPSFREIVREAHAAQAIAALPQKDRQDLLALLAILRWAPVRAIAAGLTLVALLRRVPGPLGRIARLLDLGLRGLVYTLYFSEEESLTALRWDAAVRVEARD